MRSPTTASSGATRSAGTYDEARATLAALEAIGISYDEVIELLEVEGVDKFEVSWQELLDSTQAELAKGQR